MLVYGKNVLKDIDVKRIRKVYISDNFHDQKIFNYLESKHIHYNIVSNNKLNNMIIGNHQGIVIDIDDYKYFGLKDTFNEEFVVVLDHLEDVHNFGAIIRTCEAAGVKSIIIPKDRSVHINETVMKTSCGALDRVKIILVKNLAESLKKLQKENFYIYSSFMNGVDYRTLDYSGKKVLVIGNEGKGISNIVEKITDFKVGIPMIGQINSLNASVAAGILIFTMNR